MGSIPSSGVTEKFDQIRPLVDLAGVGYSELKRVHGEKKYFLKKTATTLCRSTTTWSARTSTARNPSEST
jgi:hypothetical protein